MAKAGFVRETAGHPAIGSLDLGVSSGPTARKSGDCKSAIITGVKTQASRPTLDPKRSLSSLKNSLELLYQVDLAS